MRAVINIYPNQHLNFPHNCRSQPSKEFIRRVAIRDASDVVLNFANQHSGPVRQQKERKYNGKALVFG
jgi:hypothetical protein